MKRKKKKALILSVFMILLLAACSSRTNVRDGDDYIYCLNPDKTGLVKVSYEVQGEDVVEEAKDILREMQKPADETRYTPVSYTHLYSGAKFDPEKVDLYFESTAGKLQIIKDGTAVDYSEEKATEILSLIHISVFFSFYRSFFLFKILGI